MLSNELINYMKAQEENKAVLNVTENVRNLIVSLKGLKKDLACKLPQMFMDDDIDSIQECIDFGNKIDEFINELVVLDFGNSQGLRIQKGNVSNNSAEKARVYESVSLEVVSSNVCPNCGSQLLNNKTEYIRFTDRRKLEAAEKLTAATYLCPSCGGHYIHSQMASLLDISRTNITLSSSTKQQERNVSDSVASDKKNQIVNRGTRTTAVKDDKVCILCGQPVWKNSDYCKEHFNYGNVDKRQAGGIAE